MGNGRTMRVFLSMNRIHNALNGIRGQVPDQNVRRLAEAHGVPPRAFAGPTDTRCRSRLDFILARRDIVVAPERRPAHASIERRNH